MSEIKAVIFDVGGVLHESDTAVSDDLQETLGLTPEQTKAIWQDQIQRMGLGRLDEEAFWQEITQKYGIREVHVNEKLLTRAFAQELKQNKQMLDIAVQLGQAGLKLAILSDTNALHAGVLEAAGSYAPFAHRFLSHEVGIRKPDPRIFQEALNVLGVSPEESIFIDDNASNVAAAATLGMHGILFESTEQFVRDLTALLPDITLELNPAI